MSKKNTLARTSAPAVSAKTGIPTLLLRRSCIWYTGISAAILLIMLIFGDATKSIGPASFFFLLPFAVCLSCAGLTRQADKLPTWARVLLHPVLALGGFELFVYLPAHLTWSPMTPAGGVFLFVLAAVIYGITTLVIWLCTRHKRQKKLDSVPYQSQFKPKH